MSKASPEFLARLDAELALYLKFFGRLVNQVRDEQERSQEQMADSLGISRTEMHHVESGDTDMKLSTFIRICRGTRHGFGGMAAHLEHLVDHPEDRPLERPLKTRRGKNTRCSVQ